MAKSDGLPKKPRVVRKQVASAVKEPVRRSSEVMESIADQIAEGTPLREICRQPGMPTWRATYQWMEEDLEFAARIARARDLGFDAVAAQSLEIVDAEPERGPDGKIDSASVAHAKLRAEHRLKLLAKWSPKKYGDKIEATLQGANGGPIQMANTVTFVKAQHRDKDEDE